MKYHIETSEGLRIASFMNECDRDLFLDILRDDYSDCTFVDINEE